MPEYLLTLISWQAGAGEQCDEYPFASALDADEGGQVSRCVEETQNRHESNRAAS